MASQGVNILLMVIAVLIVAFLVLAITGSAASSVGQSGGGGACNLYCVFKDMTGVQLLPIPEYCGC